MCADLCGWICHIIDNCTSKNHYHATTRVCRGAFIDQNNIPIYAVLWWRNIMLIFVFFSLTENTPTKTLPWLEAPLKGTSPWKHNLSVSKVKVSTLEALNYQVPVTSRDPLIVVNACDYPLETNEVRNNVTQDLQKNWKQLSALLRILYNSSCAKQFMGGIQQNNGGVQ